MRRVLVTGSRNWTDRDAVIDAVIAQANADDDYHVILVHGDCPTGADAVAADICAQNADNRYFTITAEPHPADWNTHGKAAGPLRNQEMVALGADVCLAFPLPDSRGTRDCIRRAAAAGIPVIEHLEAS